MRRPALLACALLGLASSTAPAVMAASVVIYLCTDAGGALTVQNDVPCPKGTRQERTIVEPAPPMPAYDTSAAPGTMQPLPVPAITAAGAAARAAEAPPARPDAPIPLDLAADARLPPPPIHQCNTWNNDSYLSEDPAPKPRCVRLETTGPGGDPSLGAGAACEMKYDQCERVGDAAACEAWARRQREIESTWRHAKGGDRPALQEEFLRVGRILADTTCGG
ncbi:MAG TPA: DUF4124 domain-containing protein [Luteimonas sp.]|nr:DUF4124 domain-containing protein [Luteimonas sp.]